MQTKQTSAIIPNFLRVSIVNYKSAAYLAGLETGDFIVEVNGRNTLSMSHEEALQLIKQSYDVNNYVRLLVVSYKEQKSLKVYLVSILKLRLIHLLIIGSKSMTYYPQLDQMIRAYFPTRIILRTIIVTCQDYARLNCFHSANPLVLV